MEKAQETGVILTRNQRSAVPGWVTAALGMVAALVATGCASEDVTPGGEMDTIGDSNGVVVIASGDFNGDGNTDFGLITKSDEGYSATELLNNGAGAYKVRTSDEYTKTTDLRAVNWIETDTGDINELTATVPGLAMAVDHLNQKQRANLGLNPGEGTARNYYDCPADWMCFWWDIDFSGGYFFTASGYDTTYVGDWFNDRASSYRNDTWSPTTVYQHANYYGQVGQIWAKTNDGSIHDWGGHSCFVTNWCCDSGQFQQWASWADCISSYTN